MKTIGMDTRISIKNIVFTTDLSLESYAALPFATDLAKSYGAKVWALHVLPPPSRPLRSFVETPTIERDPREVTREVGEILGERLQKTGTPYEIVTEHGEPWKVLSSFIDQNQIDLVVMGTHGRSGLGKALLGSFAESVFRQCECPVLTVGPKTLRLMDQLVEMKRILLATDFTPASRAAAAYAISLAQEHQSQLVLLHVLEAPKAGELMTEDEFKEAALRLLRDMVPPEEKLWCDPEPILRYGSPADCILEIAENKEAELIVLGVRKPERHLGVMTHLGRATAYRVVCEAPCPVLTVRA